MEYINTYLDKMRVLLERGGDDQLIKELTDESIIESMFISDAKKVWEKFRSGEIPEEDARKNLQLLKLYVISQLSKHRRKVLEFYNDAENLPELDAEMIKRVVEFIEDAEWQL